jgi:hypothetical protein
VLEAGAPETERGDPDVRHTASVPGQIQSNRGPKNEFADGERMIKRLVAQELVLSFVPNPEQRLGGEGL